MPRFGWGSLGGKNKLPSFLDIITLAGALSSLKVCLDPADINSYDASAQYIKDVSGNTYDFGNYPISGSNDGKTPASGTLNFSGTLGGLSANEYLAGTQFSGNVYRGGLQGRLAGHLSSAPTYTFADNYHTAGAQWTIIGVLYSPSSNNTWSLFQTARHNGTYLTKGMLFCRIGDNGRLYTTGDKPSFTARTLHITGRRNNSNDGVGNINSGLTVPADQWVFCAVSLDSVAGNAYFRSNGSTNLVSASWGGGSSGDITTCGIDAGTDLDPSDSRRFGPLAIWSRALSAADVTSIYNLVKQYRYTTLP